MSFHSPWKYLGYRQLGHAQEVCMASHAWKVCLNIPAQQGPTPGIPGWEEEIRGSHENRAPPV